MASKEEEDDLEAEFRQLKANRDACLKDCVYDWELRNKQRSSPSQQKRAATVVRTIAQSKGSTQTTTKATESNRE
jgi:hypothetical protein